MKTHIFLASQSPRRRALLEQIGFKVTTCPVDTNEDELPDEDPRDYVARIVKAKLNKALMLGELDWQQHQALLVADTVVVVESGKRLILLHKPIDEADSFSMLKRLQHRTHLVITRFALAVRRTDCPEVFTFEQSVESTVTMRAISEDEMAMYVASGEGVDKAGGYAIQGIASRFIARIEGSYHAIMGLPVCEVSVAYQLLSGNGLSGF